MQMSIDIRPFKLSDVYGQPSVVKELTKRFKDNNIPKAILLKGQYGCGKTTISKIIAMTLNCEHVDTKGEPCGKCSVCKDIMNETFSQDTRVLDGGATGKEGVIEFGQMAQMSPMYNKNSVYIIEEADQLSPAAKNSLLKLLEKPQDNVYFILLSMVNTGIPAALQSRCQVYKFNPFSTTDIMLALKGTLEKIGKWGNPSIPMSFYTEGLRTIGESSNGSLRTAIQLLDKCVSGDFFSTEEISEHLGIISPSTVHGMLMDALELKKVFFDKLETVDIQEFFNLGYTLISDALAYRITKEAKREYFEAQTRAMAETRYLVEVANIFDEVMQTTYIRKQFIESKFAQMYISKRMRIVEE